MSCECESSIHEKSINPCTCAPEVAVPKCFVGTPAPQFEGEAVLPDGSFKKISLESYKGKYVVLFFYPMDFTLVCPTEIIAFSEQISEFQSCGCEVIAASCDSVYSHLAWTKLPRNAGGLGEMKIPILSDKSLDIARKYNILIENKGISHRGLFIIDKEGILRQIIVNDLPVGRSVDETLRLVQAYQFTDEHGEICPANWKKGEKSLDSKK
uniref:thioredoxin-dependent peroxiredoxin n=1 Tax=Myxobolus squamalis TaxID=59785 RepID=A0A6B2G6K1_MYXSQ